MAEHRKRAFPVLALVLLIVYVGASGAGASETTDQERTGFFGPVHTVVEEIAKYSAPLGEWIEGPRVISVAYVFDEQGNCVEKNRYKPDGSLDQRRTYRYDDQGNLREETCHYSSLPSSLSSSSPFDCRTVYMYDSDGNVIDAAEYGSDGSLLWFYVYAYDSRGNKVEEFKYDGKGSVRTKTVYSYDEKGNIIERLEYRPDGSLSSRQTHKYDNNGNELENTEYKPDGSVAFRRVSNYDGNGHVSEVVFYSSVAHFRSVYRRDEKGNIIESTHYDQYGCERYAYQYEFDLYGNCIKKTTSKWVTEEGKSYWKPWEVTYRTITYY